MKRLIRFLIKNTSLFKKEIDSIKREEYNVGIKEGIKFGLRESCRFSTKLEDRDYVELVNFMCMKGIRFRVDPITNKITLMQDLSIKAYQSKREVSNFKEVDLIESSSTSNYVNIVNEKLSDLIYKEFRFNKLSLNPVLQELLSKPPKVGGVGKNKNSKSYNEDLLFTFAAISGSTI